MDNWSKEKKEAWRELWRSELGKATLELVKSLRQDQLDQALLLAQKDGDSKAIHDLVQRAAGIDLVVALATQPSK